MILNMKDLQKLFLIRLFNPQAKISLTNKIKLKLQKLSLYSKIYITIITSQIIMRYLIKSHYLVIYKNIAPKTDSIYFN